MGSGPSAKSRLLGKRMLRCVVFGGLLSISFWYISGCSVSIVFHVFGLSVYHHVNRFYVSLFV